MVFVVANDGLTTLSVSVFDGYGLIEEMNAEYGPEVVIPLPDIDPDTLRVIFDSDELNNSNVLDVSHTAQVVGGIIYLKAHPRTMNRWISRLPVNYAELIPIQYLDILWRNSNTIPVNFGNSCLWKKLVICFCDFIGVEIKQDLYICHLVNIRLNATQMTIQNYCDNLEHVTTMGCNELIKIIEADTLCLLPATLFTRTFKELGTTKTAELFKFYTNRKIALPHFTYHHVVRKLALMRQLATDEDENFISLKGQALLFEQPLHNPCYSDQNYEGIFSEVTVVIVPAPRSSKVLSTAHTDYYKIESNYLVVDKNHSTVVVIANWLNNLIAKCAHKVIELPNLNNIASQFVHLNLSKCRFVTIVVF
jgi:hypothetical protein